MAKSDSATITEDWKTIKWRKAERYVFKLQKRIFAASRRGDVRQVRKLQRTLVRSWSNKVLAVRRVTVENQGKKTAGVDGIKLLPPEARLELAKELKLTGDSKPTRRVWIPKPGSDEKRPLGIPVMVDRALQAVVKAALEPEWEARFEPNSYGFVRLVGVAFEGSNPRTRHTSKKATRLKGVKREGRKPETEITQFS